MYLTSIATVFRLPANYESLTRGPTVCGSRPDPSGIRPDGCGRALWRRARAREREREREMKVKLTFASGPRCRRNGARKITKMKMEEEERKEKVLRRPFAGVAVLAVTEFSNQLGHTVDRFYWALFFCLVLKRTFNFCFHTTIAKFYRLLPGFAGFFFSPGPQTLGFCYVFILFVFFWLFLAFFWAAHVGRAAICGHGAMEEFCGQCGAVTEPRESNFGFRTAPSRSTQHSAGEQQQQQQQQQKTKEKRQQQ